MAKLPKGAAHIYLWGQDIFWRTDDITDWKAFARELNTQGRAHTNSPAKRIWSQLKAEPKKLIATIANSDERPDRFTQSQVIEALNQVLARADLYDETIWPGGTLDASTGELARKGRTKLNEAELCRLNSRLLFAAFPQSAGLTG